MALLVRNPHVFEYHYSLTCPYCRITEDYLLNPLQAMGVIRVIRINIEHVRGRAVVENLRFAYVTGDEDVATPTILDRTCKHMKFVFIPVKPSKEEWTAAEAVANMADNIIDHLCRWVQVYNPRTDLYRPLNVRDLTRNVMIRQLLNREVQ